MADAVGYADPAGGGGGAGHLHRDPPTLSRPPEFLEGGRSGFTAVVAARVVYSVDFVYPLSLGAFRPLLRPRL